MIYWMLGDDDGDGGEKMLSISCREFKSGDKQNIVLE